MYACSMHKIKLFDCQSNSILGLRDSVRFEYHVCDQWTKLTWVFYHAERKACALPWISFKMILHKYHPRLASHKCSWTIPQFRIHCTFSSLSFWVFVQFKHRCHVCLMPRSAAMRCFCGPLLWQNINEVKVAKCRNVNTVQFIRSTKKKSVSYILKR